MRSRVIVVVALAALVVTSSALANRVSNNFFMFNRIWYWGDEYEAGTDPWYTFDNAGFLDYWGYWDDGPCAVLYGDDPLITSGGVFQPGRGGAPAVDGDLGGISFSFSVWMWPEWSWDANLYLVLEFMGDDDTTLVGETWVEQTEIPSAWTRYTMTAIAPEGTFYVRPSVRFENAVSDDSWGEWCYIDDAELIVAGNLVTNPGFEHWGEGWEYYEDAPDWDMAWFWGQPDFHAHLWGGTEEYNASVFQKGIRGAPGSTYELSVDMGFEAQWWGTVAYGIQFMAADDTTVVDESMVTMSPGAGMPDPPIDYQRYSMSAVAPAGTFYVRPLVRHTNAAGPSDARAAVLDNVVLLDLTGGSDVDIDGVDDTIDVCHDTPPGIPVDDQGRPVGDIDGDCDVDLDDYGLFQQSFTGPS